MKGNMRALKKEKSLLYSVANMWWTISFYNQYELIFNSG